MSDTWYRTPAVMPDGPVEFRWHLAMAKAVLGARLAHERAWSEALRSMVGFRRWYHSQPADPGLSLGLVLGDADLFGVDWPVVVPAETGSWLPEETSLQRERRFLGAALQPGRSGCPGGAASETAGS